MCELWMQMLDVKNLTLYEFVNVSVSFDKNTCLVNMCVIIVLKSNAIDDKRHVNHVPLNDDETNIGPYVEVNYQEILIHIVCEPE